MVVEAAAQPSAAHGRGRSGPIRFTIFDRYLLTEFAGPFVLGILGISLLMLSQLLFELTDWLIVKKVALSVILSLLVYRLPDTFVDALPIALLFAALLSIGRLARDSELTVLLGGGMSLPRVMTPVLVLSLVLSGLAFATHERVTPWANHRFENIVRRIVFQDASPDIQEGIFFRGQDDTFFYVRRLERDRMVMSDVMVYKLNGSPFPEMITAKRATFRNGVWYLEQGVTRDLDGEGFVTNEARFGSLEIRADASADQFFGNQKTTDEMSRAELAKNIELFGKSGVDIRPFLVDYHLKLAAPFANLFFILLGLPLALFSLRLPRNSRFLGIGVSAALVLSYYVLTPFCRSLGVNGVLTPLMAAWLPNGAFAVVGIIFFLLMQRI